VSTLTALGSKEAEMKIIGCNLHTSQQTISMLGRDTGEIVEKTLKHEGGPYGRARSHASLEGHTLSLPESPSGHPSAHFAA